MPKRLLSLFLFATPMAALAEVSHISVHEARALAGQGVAVVDVRRADEWQATGVMPGSRLLTFFDDAGRSDPPAWRASFQQHRATHQPVILVCRSGNRSGRVAQWLAQQGHSGPIYNVRGGMNAWQQAGFPVSTPNPQLTCAIDARC